MKRYYGAMIAEPQGVTIKDNSTGVFGFGRSSITSVSLVADSIYDQVHPGDLHRQRNAGELQGRGGPRRERLLRGAGDRGRRTAHLLHAAHYEDLNGNPVAMGSTGAVFVGSTLDGQAQHGWPNQPTYGIRQVLGADPAGRRRLVLSRPIREHDRRRLAQGLLRQLDATRTTTRPAPRSS